MSSISTPLNLDFPRLALPPGVEELPVLVFTTRPDGVEEYCSPQWRVALGFDPMTKSARSYWERVVHPDDQARAKKAWMESIAHGNRYEVIYRLRVADGSWRYHLSCANLQYSPRGNPLKWVGTCTDIHSKLDLIYAQLNANYTVRPRFIF